MKLEVVYGFDLSKSDIPAKKARKILRNLVDPAIGAAIFNSAINNVKKQNLQQLSFI